MKPRRGLDTGRKGGREGRERERRGESGRGEGGEVGGGGEERRRGKARRRGGKRGKRRRRKEELGPLNTAGACFLDSLRVDSRGWILVTGECPAWRLSSRVPCDIGTLGYFTPPHAPSLASEALFFLCF